MLSLKRTGLDIVPQLLDILMTDYPGGVVAAQMLQMYAECYKIVPDLDIRLYTPGGEVDAYGTFFVHIPEHRGNMIFHTLDQDLDTFKHRIRELPDLKWESYPCPGPIDDKFHTMFLQIMEEEGLHYAETPKPANNFVIPRQEALNLDITVPEGLEIRPVTVEHAEFINDRWPPKADNTLKYIVDVIKTRGGVALFKEDNNEMIAWVLFSLVGGVGMIQTAPEHRGKGYGFLVGKAMTKIVAESGWEPNVQVRPHLTNSMRLFTKIGYKFTHTVHWYHVGR